MLPTLTGGSAHTSDREWSVHQKLTSELRVIDESSPTDSSPIKADQTYITDGGG